jgi:hypothetical protein
MEEFAGVIGNWHEGVFFTEGIVQQAGHPCGAIKVEISRQNSNLSQVKSEMARQAKAKGANVIQVFRYGQKAHKWWELIFTFKWDTESWYGNGDAVVVRAGR